MPELKTAFILRELSKYNEEVIKAMKAAFKKAGVGVTEEGYNSLAYKSFQSGGGAYSNLTFNEYLRFVDMGVGRGHPLGGLRAVTVELQASRTRGLAHVKDKIRRPKKIYAKVAYGKIGYLQNKLLHGYTEETIAALKAELLNKPQP